MARGVEISGEGVLIAKKYSAGICILLVFIKVLVFKCWQVVNELGNCNRDVQKARVWNILVDDEHYVAGGRFTMARTAGRGHKDGWMG